MNELKLFQNEEFGKLRVVEQDGEIWFVAKDVCEGLNIVNVSQALSNLDSVMRCVVPTNGGNQRMLFIAELEVIKLISKSRNLSGYKKELFKNWLVSEGLIEDKFVIQTRKEIEFLELLENVLEPFNYTTHRQYNVNGNRIDFYIEDLNIAIEYDENNHVGYSHEQHGGRQKAIESELGCRFIRLSDKDSNTYNVGLVMKGLVF